MLTDSKTCFPQGHKSTFLLHIQTIIRNLVKFKIVWFCMTLADGF